MIRNWKYNGNGKFLKMDCSLPDEFGCSDFTDKHYNFWAAFPDSDISKILSCYEVKTEFEKKLPRFMIDLEFGEGDFLCFDASWEVVNYLSHIMPFIQYQQYQSETE